jgi:GT2 family glycosyltransferase/glycosyltransferase involved in cell wall biosynthesis
LLSPAGRFANSVVALTTALTDRTAAAAERDGNISDLKQIILERDSSISNLKQAMSERDSNISDLKQIILERNKKIAQLEKLVVATELQLKSSLHRIEEIEKSHSWRITAPYRAIGGIARRGIEAVKGSQILTRLLVSGLLLPAAFVYYEGLWGFISALPRQRQLFGTVIANRAVVCDRLSLRAQWYKRLVLVNLSLAIRINRAGSLLTSRLVDHARARRILVADYRIPRADVSAGERATLGILMDLCALGYEVVFLPNDMAPSPHEKAELKALGVEVITRDDGYRYPAHYLTERGHQFGAFYIFRVEVAEAILPVARQVAPNARVIFHSPDLYSLREMREAEFHHDDVARSRAHMTRDREIAVMRQADQIVVQSPVEVPLLQAEMPGASVTVFPALYAPVVREPGGFSQRHNVFFLGGFGHRPNISAVHWFAVEVWPRVRAALPDAEFHIIGAEPPESVVKLGRLPGIKVIGFVRDLDSVLKTMRVGVAPLLYGAGIKGKVAMTMGAGIPCVCTDIAAEGMYMQDHLHTMIANEAHTFTDAVVKLYSDEAFWNRLSQNGKRLITGMFSEAANRSSLLAVLNAADVLPIGLFSDYCRALAPRPVDFPDPQTAVDVSIIITVHNQWLFTRACLNSILETSLCDGICCELILADDVSSDETLRAAQLYPGLKVVRTEKNVGFLRNCNNAARHARGRYILFLNNDTVVLPGWLAHLYRTLEEDDDVVIAGSKLLYPDGLIQEAGAVLFNDGTAHNVGRGYARYMPVFNIERETDYVSGASILVRRSFWDAVGGFDERYNNAYCEDCDLAMIARSRGLRVVYQPASEVVHFEHQSYADQAPSHDATLQRENIQRLLQKWHDILQRDHCAVVPWQLAASRAERAVPPSALARRRKGRLNILYFSPFPSHPSNHGNHANIQQFARHFQSFGHKVHFALLQSQMYTRQDEEAMFEAWDSLDILPNSHPLLADGSAIPFDGWYEDGLGERIRVLCDRYDIDVVFCSYVFQSKLLEYVPSYILTVIDTHDKMGDRYEMLRSNGQPLEFFSCTQQEEGAYLRRADVVVARRQEEAQYFDSVTGRNSTIVIPYFEDPHYLDLRFNALRHVGIVASANQINLACVRECVAAIERRLAGAPCPFEMHIAGQVGVMVSHLPAAEAAIFRKPWVRLHGFVPDIAKFYCEMDLVVSPVTMGTGINIKTVQAMAYGMPLLTTLCGSKGIETGDPMHCHVDLDALSESLLTILKNPSALTRLAAVSRERYDRFYEAGMGAMRGLFRHRKLLSAQMDYVEIGECSAVMDEIKHPEKMGA